MQPALPASNLSRSLPLEGLDVTRGGPRSQVHMCYNHVYLLVKGGTQVLAEIKRCISERGERHGE